MNLCRDVDAIASLLAANASEDAPPITDIAAWLDNPGNFALVEGNDLALFEAKSGWPGPLEAHVFFASRGKAAITIAKRMLAQAFDFGATEILGETPVALPHAVLFAKLLGFQKTGERETKNGPVIVSRIAQQNPSHSVP